MPIKFSHLNYVYSKDTPLETAALHDINLDIIDGSFVCLVGHTGSGKSTLIQHINALLTPTSGSVDVNGIKVMNKKDKKGFLKSLSKEERKHQNIKEIRKNVGLVFQFPEYQLFEETVLKDVSFGPKNFGFSDEEAIKKAKESLKLVGIDESLYDKSPFELSGGQRRRVAIAGIISLNPDILILDEPTAGLDPQGSNEMMELFNILYKNGTTIIMVTHDMDIVIKYATDVIVLKKGEIILECKPHSLFLNDEILKELCVEEPKPISFAKDLIKNGMKIDLENVKDTDTLIEEICKARVKYE